MSDMASDMGDTENVTDDTKSVIGVMGYLLTYTNSLINITKVL